MDMIDALDRIQQYLEGVDLPSFSTRGLVFDAVTLNFAVLGESSVRVEDFLRDQHPELPWDQLRGLRNRSPTATRLSEQNSSIKSRASNYLPCAFSWNVY